MLSLAQALLGGCGLDGGRAGPAPADVGSGPRAPEATGPLPDGGVGDAGAGQDSAGTVPNVSPEAAWLAGIGTGPAQTARVCARGGGDPVARALCADPTSRIGGLLDLQARLGLDLTGSGQRLLGMTAHSASLVARSVSAINPRLIIAGGPSRLDRGILALGFARGEPFVELVGYDEIAKRLNFYLLAFEPSCAGARCAPAELLTERVEEGWRGWTLYRDGDLTNTGFDCLSCHQPEGPGAPRRLLMREVSDPWMHWFPTEPTHLSCPSDGSGGAERIVEYQETQLWATFQRARAGERRYGGIDLATLGTIPGGHDIATFLAIFEAKVGVRFPTVVGEPHVFPSAAILSEDLCQNTGATWSKYRSDLLARGLPVPFRSPDVLDPGRGAAAAADYPAYLAERREAEPFEVAAGLLAEPASEAAGFRPARGLPAEEILRQACVRCHDDATDPSLSRARFNAESLGNLRPEAAREALRRINLPGHAPGAMPPRRFGDLPPWARETLASLLR